MGVLVRPAGDALVGRVLLAPRRLNGSAVGGGRWKAWAAVGIQWDWIPTAGGIGRKRARSDESAQLHNLLFLLMYLARPAGIEPATLGFGGQYSIH